MKTNKVNPNYLSASKVANILDVSVKTLTNWYKWYYDDTIEKNYDFPKLPDYIQEYTNGPRYWTLSDIPMLKKFQEWVPRGRNGVMGKISEKYTSKYWKDKKENE